MAETLIIVPTYNEKENIEPVISEIFKHAPGADILVVDDDSSDGTAEILDRLSKKDGRISVMHRLSKRGRGSAGIEAFKEALKREEIKYVIEMDGDFSHGPQYIPVFLESIKDADVIIGSRYVKGGEDSDRGYARIILSKAANLFIRKYLKLDFKDCTAGFRCFKKHVLASLDLDNMLSREPSIIEEILYESNLRGYKIKEVPIIFKDRKAGKTKLGFIKLMRVLIDITRFKNRRNIDILTNEFRRFGFNLGLGLNIGGFIMFSRHKEYFIWFTAAGSLSVIAAISAPRLLKPVKKFLEGAIFCFGRLISFISLAIAFYSIFVPIGAILKLFNKDPLHQKIDRKLDSYWMKKEQKAPSENFYERMG